MKRLLWVVVTMAGVFVLAVTLAREINAAQREICRLRAAASPARPIPTSQEWARVYAQLER